MCDSTEQEDAMTGILKRVTSSLQNLRRQFGMSENGEELPVFSVLILGDAHVGKYALYNALTRKLNHNELGPRPDQVETSTTVYDCGEVISTLLFKYINTAKKSYFLTKATTQAMKEADGFILCFSLLDKQSFTALDSQVNSLRESTHMKDKTVVLVGCRADEQPHEVSREDISQYTESIRQRGWRCKYLETSAYQHQNVDKVEEIFVQQCKERRLDGIMQG